jgi:PPE-repeat protein
LGATHLCGQNTPAIAATETLYAEMWAQDATAMYGYAGTSASATTLTPFSPAPQTTTGASAAMSTQAAASQAISAGLQGLTSTAATTATPASALDTLSDLAGLILFLPGVAQAGLAPLNTTGLFTDLSFDDDELHFEGLESTDQDILKTFTFNGWHLPPDVALESGLTRPVMALGPAEVRSVTAGLGQAPTVGTLSVPQAWTVAAPEIRLAALTSPSAGLGAAPEVMASSSPGSLFSEMTLANMAGRVITGTTTRGRQERTGTICRSRTVSTPTSPSGHGTAIAADIRQFAEALVTLGDLRDSGLLTDEEFTDQKERLLAR